jgi:hypothetical protein
VGHVNSLVLIWLHRLQVQLNNSKWVKLDRGSHYLLQQLYFSRMHSGGVAPSSVISLPDLLTIYRTYRKYCNLTALFAFDTTPLFYRELAHPFKHLIECWAQDATSLAHLLFQTPLIIRHASFSLSVLIFIGLFKLIQPRESHHARNKSVTVSPSPV